MQMFEKYKSSNEYKLKLAKYMPVILYVSFNTGLKINDFSPLFKLYYNLKSQENYGLRLPDWTEKVFPSPLDKTVIEFYKSLTISTEGKKFVAGFLLKSILEEMKEKISRKAPDNRKIYLYSGHEITIAFLLITLGVFDEKPPNFGSYVIMELHKLENDYGIKFHYQNYDGQNPKILRPPFCDEDICKFNSVLRETEKYFPNDNECENFSDI